MIAATSQTPVGEELGISIARAADAASGARLIAPSRNRDQERGDRMRYASTLIKIAAALGT